MNIEYLFLQYHGLVYNLEFDSISMTNAYRSWNAKRTILSDLACLNFLSFSILTFR